MPSLIPDLLPVPSATVVREATGTIFIWTPAPGVFVTRLEGRLTEAGARGMTALFRKQIATDGRLVVFNDFEDTTGYDTSARVLLTRVGMDLRRSIDLTHFLVRARIVALGVHLANAILGNMRAYTSREPFEALLRSTIADRHGRAAAAL